MTKVQTIALVVIAICAVVVAVFLLAPEPTAFDIEVDRFMVRADCLADYPDLEGDWLEMCIEERSK